MTTSSHRLLKITAERFHDEHESDSFRGPCDHMYTPLRLPPESSLKDVEAFLLVRGSVSITIQTAEDSRARTTKLLSASVT